MDAYRQTHLCDGVLIEENWLATVPADCHEIHVAAMLHQAGFINRFEIFIRVLARQNCTNVSTQTMLAID